MRNQPQGAEGGGLFFFGLFLRDELAPGHEFKQLEPPAKWLVDIYIYIYMYINT